MSKFLLEKKKLIEDVYEKASKETTETSFSGILLHLEQVLKDDFESLSYKSFENYYKALVENDEDYKIKPSILDNLSKYLGFESFRDYCSGWKSFEYKITQALSNLAITIINKPIIKMPDFLTKQSNMGIIGVLLIAGFFGGNYINKNQLVEKVDTPINLTDASIFAGRSTDEEIKKPREQNQKRSILKINESTDSSTLETPQCMYWDGKEYIAEVCNSTKNGLIALDLKILENLKKITSPDTITEKSLGKVWYSKLNNNVEFFTYDGENPENGKELRKLTKYMLEKYAR